MTSREIHRNKSNNKNNPNKNVCALAVATALGVDEEVRYLHKMEDLIRASRKAYNVRSRGQVKGMTVGKARTKLEKIGAEVDARYFIVHVDGHVLLLGHNGQTLIDTAPRKRDSRKIWSCYVVYKK